MRQLLFALLITLAAASPRADEISVARAVARWEQSSHGEFLKRILPPAITPARLPEAQSPGAKLTVQYCVQCHYLVNPAMHDDAKWPKIVERMLPRMQGRGNMGKLMHEMMTGADGKLQAPTAAEVATLTAYLQRHAQKPLAASSAKIAETELRQGGGLAFARACSQCHTLPDPQAHTRAEWAGVVKRMEGNMAWMNRVVGSKPQPGEPQLSTDEIAAFLARYARR